MIYETNSYCIASRRKMDEMKQQYECDQCGACCRSLIVEAGWLDALREPKILNVSRHALTLDDLKDGSRCVVLYDRQTKACPFLVDRQDSKCDCSIYPTRPNECVACQAGDPKCQQARMQCGLPLLRDTDGNHPNLESWRDYGDVYGHELIDELIEQAQQYEKP